MVQGDDDRGFLDGLPWRHRTRQQQGRETERKVVKRRGLIPHPNSGAGPIKDDAHDEESVYEIKDARKQYTIKADEMLATHRRAIRQGRQAVWVVVFDDLGIEVEMHIHQLRSTR